MSEGQAYGLLLTAATRDRQRFRTIWAWTRDHLERNDGLFAWHWADGHIVDNEPASDADVLIATALAVGAQRFGSTEYRADAIRIARAVRAQEVVPTAIGPVLVAGPWARRPTPVVNPSYFVPFAFDLLRTTTGDGQWAALAATAGTILTQLAAHALPPDWAALNSSGVATPHAAPDGAPPQFGFDAVRIPIMWGAAQPTERLARVVAGWDQYFQKQSSNNSCVLPLRLDGTPLQNASPVAIACLASSASASSADSPSRANALLERARLLSAARSTYYGDAWLALAQQLPTLR